MYLLKHKDVPVRGAVKMPRTGIKGAFRCILRGADGRIKQETPWQDNLITDYGTSELRDSWYSYLLVGTDTTPPSFTKNTLGAYLAISSQSSPLDPVIDYIGTAPLYERVTFREYDFVPGVGTGLLTEIGLASDTSGTHLINTHALLDVPINKGASDNLTVQYRMTAYHEVNDVSGNITIGGENFWYTVRGYNFEKLWGAAGPWNYNWPEDRQFYRGGIMTSLVPLTGQNPTSLLYQPDFQVQVSQGGSLGGYYSDVQMNYGVNSSNDSWFSSMCIWPSWGGLYAYNWSNPGWQMIFGRVSDNTGIYKENTHHLQFTMRQYSDRWLP
jgi:hypothetical protein